MKIQDQIFARNSEDDFSRNLVHMANAGAGVIHIRTTEIMRTVLACRRTAVVEGYEYHEWDVVYGNRKFTPDTIYELHKEGDKMMDIGASIDRHLNNLPQYDSAEKVHFLVYVNPQYWLESPAVAHYILQASNLLPATLCRIILVTPDIPLPEIIGDAITSVRMEPPGYSELNESISRVLGGTDEDAVEDISEEERQTICFAGAGMSRENFETHLSLSIVRNATKDNPATAESLIKGVSSGKTEIVNKNDILELYPSEDMSNVGGMENLKEWIRKRRNCYSDQAVEFGIEPPKGAVFLGPPGTGKSLVAKAISKEMGVPLVRLDFGRVFNSLVGKSEERVRTALRSVEFMAPCVLFVDEIDKGLGGIGGGGDSGTSSRVLGTFLTWLQENKTPVFTLVTANNVTGLPPELLRRGRFDAIFASGLPAMQEKIEVLKIHLRKRGWEGALSDKDLQRVATVAKGYVPAELESAVKDALIDAFNEDEDLTADHVIKALQVMVPLSKSHSEAIQAMTLWAKNNATPASKSYDDIEEDGKVTSMSRRRTRVTSPTKDKNDD